MSVSPTTRHRTWFRRNIDVRIAFKLVRFMNPHYYLWLTESLELLAFFVLQPVIGIVIAYKAWRGEPQNLSRYGVPCLASGATAVVLLVLAKWLNADVRTVIYVLQVACIVLGFSLFGVCMGCGFSFLLRIWHWHKSTRIS